MDYSSNWCQDVLTTWFNRGGVTGYPCTWNGLMKALKDIELNNVAAEIEIALNCVQSL